MQVGCGYGCSIYPLMDAFPDIFFVGSDYSEHALNIMSKHQKFDANRVRSAIWDVCKPFPDIGIGSVDAVLMIFALSAVAPADHRIALRNIFGLLSDGGVLLFRDYGVCDMTMYRHTVRKSDKLYQRSDGTLSYYFDLDYVRELCVDMGFRVVELKYATVLNRNRKKGIDMRRVFVHAVLQK
jgi:methyltransferase-like protein 6